jgi:hypothetical protein
LRQGSDAVVRTASDRVDGVGVQITELGPVLDQVPVLVAAPFAKGELAEAKRRRWRLDRRVKR